jgi:hypothetical protein
VSSPPLPPPRQGSSLPGTAKLLGYAGLLPQVLVVAVLASGSTWWRFAALSLGYAYAGLILSFLGGMWWGLAAARPDRAPAGLWLAAVAPSLISLATTIPWATGAAWPGPSLVVIGVVLIASLAVDRWLVSAGLAPAWWMTLRVPLSLGLGGLTIATAFMA